MERIGRWRARRALRASCAAAVLMSLVVGVSACGGDDGGGADGTPPAQSAELAACLEENGIAAGTGMPDQDTRERIRAACGELIPQVPGAGSGGPPGGLDPSAIGDCLREAGIDVPEGDDPSALMGAIDPSDPEVVAALQACGLGPPGS